MKPLFKYPGGKRREIKYIEKYLPKNIDTYVEPFMGGGALYFHLKPEKSIIAENSANVRNFYNVLKENPEKLKTEINKIVEEYNGIDKSEMTKDEIDEIGKKYYYKYRDDMYVKNGTGFEQAIRFFMIRQLCFSGMVRHNKSGKENVPFGYYKRIKNIDQDTEKLTKLIKGTTIYDDAFKLTNKTKENDFIFLDPPYTRKFIEYHEDGQFGKEEHLKLFEWFSTTKSKAMIVLNYDDFTGELYRDYIKEVYDKTYSIEFRGRMTDSDKKTGHFIAINYKEEEYAK